MHVSQLVAPLPIPSCLCTEEVTLWNNGRLGVSSGSSLPTSQEARLAGPHPHPRCPCSNARHVRLQIRTKVFPQTFHSLKLLPSMQFSQGDVAYLSRLKSGNSPRNPIFQKEKKNLDSSPWSLTCPRHWPPYRGSFSVGNTHSKAPQHPQSSSWGSRTTCTHEL